MERRRHLFRDFGLTLGLVLIAVLVYWRTTLPALQKNRELDRRQLEMQVEAERRRGELEELRASERAYDDPIEIERVQRAQHGELGLPANERAEPIDEKAAAGTSAAAASRRE